jgi:hypothetical protein
MKALAVSVGIDMREAREETFWARIFMAGDIAMAQKVCQQFVDEKGLCVTLEPCKYIYTGGMEEGFEVGLINYPRFPSTSSEITDIALRLADHLRITCNQGSYSVMTPTETIWRTWRGD